MKPRVSWPRTEALVLAILTLAACERATAAWEVVTPPGVAPKGAPQLVDSSTGSAISVDFGVVPVGVSLSREVVIRNAGAATFTVMKIDHSEGFPEVFEVATDSFSVDAGRQFSLVITFRPSTTDEVTGVLHLDIENGDPDALGIDLRGSGLDAKGPALQVEPPALDFEEVAVDTYQMKMVVLWNAGVDAAGTADDNLVFAVKDGPSDWVEKRPEITGPDAADFTFQWPPMGYTSTGLAQGQYAELRVRFSPTTEGQKSATLVVYTNDPSHMVAEVPLRGLALNLPPCDFIIRPRFLNFGALRPNVSQTLSFEIVNLDSNPSHDCFISMLDLTRTTYQQGAFALPNGPIEFATIRGGEALEIPVRFQPGTNGSFDGVAEFFISSPMEPDIRVQLIGITAPP